MRSYSNIDNQQVIATEKATPPNSRVWPILVNFDDKFIFVCGGQNERSVDVYDIYSNSWKSAPAMNQTRYQGGGCSLQDLIYVICGNHDRSTIEVLDARQFVSGNRVSWVEITISVLKPRFYPLIVPLSQNEIAILGGWSNLEYKFLNDGCIFNINNDAKKITMNKAISCKSN